MTMIDRRFVLGTLAMLAAAPALARGKPPVVLFICDYGTAKSAIARELFRRRAAVRAIDVTAFSRGLHLEDHISPPLRATLDAEGIDTRRDGFAILQAADMRRADLVVTFATLPRSYRPRALHDWSALPSVNEAWPAARTELDRRIDALLDEIATRRGHVR